MVVVVDVGGCCWWLLLVVVVVGGCCWWFLLFIVVVVVSVVLVGIAVGRIMSRYSSYCCCRWWLLLVVVVVHVVVGCMDLRLLDACHMACPYVCHKLQMKSVVLAVVVVLFNAVREDSTNNQ